MKNIVIFASGAGTNAENIIRYFSNEKKAKVVLVLSNKPQAKVLERAAALGVDVFFFDRRQFYDTEEVLFILQRRNTDLIVLAGFLWLVPSGMIEAYRGRIVNIHPALLPSFGGSGMYGMNVHRAVFESSVQVSGASVHFVDETYDTGRIIAQQCVDISDVKSPEEIAERVLSIEHQLLPSVIEKIALGKVFVENKRVRVET